MKALALLMLLGAAPISVTFTETQALTRAEPFQASDGFSLTGFKGLRVTLCAASGQTLSGSGTLRARYLSPKAGSRWAKGGGRDLVIPSAAAGASCWTFDDMDITVDSGRALWIADGVTASGGSTCILYVDLGFK